MVLAHILASPQHPGAGLHGTDVCPCADGAGTAHDALLVCIFDQTHLIQRPTHIALLRRALRAKAHTCSHRIEPAVYLGFQSFVGCKRVPDRGLVFQQLGQLVVKFGHRIGGVHTQCIDGRIRTQAVTIPNFTRQIFGLAKQGAVPLGVDDQPGVGFGEASQVIKVAVVAVGKIAVPVAGALWGRWDDGHASVPQLRRQLGAPLCVHGEEC